MLKELVLKTRTYRRFYGTEQISDETLRSLVDLARLTASSKNAQALRFKLVGKKDECAKLFPLVHWAGFLPEWGGPKGDEKPSAYILILADTSIQKDTKIDDGIAAQTIMLGATELGLGGCMMGAIERKQILELFSLDESRYTVELVLALGKPKEIVKIVSVGNDGSTKYFRDESQTHFVPKRDLKDIII
jgi:nitroreductase